MSTEAATTPTLRAFVKPKRPTEQAKPVALVARTGGRKTIRVREVGTAKPGVFGVYPFDLVDTHGKRIADSVLNALPWAGKGDDPLDPEGRRVALYRLPSGAPPSRVLP